MGSSSHIFTDIDFSRDFTVRQRALDALAERIAAAPVDTQAALATFVPDADRYQREVIEARHSTLRVVAPAGSGKTQTVVNRVIARIRDGVHPARLLILTFDRAATSSLKSKLQTQTSTFSIDLASLTISTLNAFGYGLLREYFPAEAKRLVPDYRQRQLVREALSGLKEKSVEHFAVLPDYLREQYYVDFFSFLKNRLFDPRNLAAQEMADLMVDPDCLHARPFLPDPTNPQSAYTAIQAISWLFIAYERAMQHYRFIDFDDQKLRYYLLLDDSPSLKRAIQAKYTEIIVDEFQDINLLDFSFIKVLSEQASLVVTGDDDQAIYGFRGCTPDFIISLDRYLSRPLASYELQINYRCPPNIVEHADRLIRHNKRRVNKNPIAFRTTPSDIKVVSTLSAALEAKSIVSFIRNIKQSNTSLQYNDFAVLYRTNAQSLPLQIEFILNGIPYFVRDEDNILGNETLERLLGVLRLKHAISSGQPPHPNDAVLTVRSYFRFIQDHQIGQLDKLFRQGDGFLEACSSEAFYAILPKARESQYLRALREVLDANTLLDTLDTLAPLFKGLKGMIGSLEDVIEEQAPLAEIYDVAADFGGIPDFVNTMERALDRAHLLGAGKDDERGVALLTYFKSKGLQWHTVVLTTCNEGIIPHRRSPIEDERRLFYVAMTRASSNLLISYVSDACKTKVSPSRFLAEAGLL